MSTFSSGEKRDAKGTDRENEGGDSQVVIAARSEINADSKADTKNKPNNRLEVSIHCENVSRDRGSRLALHFSKGWSKSLFYVEKLRNFFVLILYTTCCGESKVGKSWAAGDRVGSDLSPTASLGSTPSVLIVLLRRLKGLLRSPMHRGLQPSPRNESPDTYSPWRVTYHGTGVPRIVTTWTHYVTLATSARL